MPNAAAMLRCSSLRFVLSTLSARWPSAVHSPVNNDLRRLYVSSIFALLTLLGTNQERPKVGRAPRGPGRAIGSHLGLEAHLWSAASVRGAPKHHAQLLLDEFESTITTWGSKL